jgi:ABC-type ATPase involved in cell division
MSGAGAREVKSNVGLGAPTFVKEFTTTGTKVLYATHDEEVLDWLATEYAPPVGIV